VAEISGAFSGISGKIFGGNFGSLFWHHRENIWRKFREPFLASSGKYLVEISGDFSGIIGKIFGGNFGRLFRHHRENIWRKFRESFPASSGKCVAENSFDFLLFFDNFSVGSKIFPAHNEHIAKIAALPRVDKKSVFLQSLLALIMCWDAATSAICHHVRGNFWKVLAINKIIK